MTESRSALDVSAVLDRFVRSGQLLDEAADRVTSLGTAVEQAAENSGALREAAQALTAGARSMDETLAVLRSAHDAVRDALSVARDFLASTDISAVRHTLLQMEERLSGLEQRHDAVLHGVHQLGAEQDRRLATIMAAADRSSALEGERDIARQRLARVMDQLPARAAKKLDLPDL